MLVGKDNVEKDDVERESKLPKTDTFEAGYPKMSSGSRSCDVVI